MITKRTLFPFFLLCVVCLGLPQRIPTFSSFLAPVIVSGWSTPINLSKSDVAFQEPSIAVSGTQIHIVWSESSSIRHKIWDGSSWSNTITIGPGFNRKHALRMDSNGKPHLVYSISGSGAPFYTNYSNGIWTTPTPIWSLPGSSDYASLNVDSSNKIHVLWSNFSNGTYKIYYSFLDTQGWTSPSVVVTGTLGRPSFSVDSSGVVHVVYEATGIYYKKWDGQSWSNPKLLSSGGTMYYPDIATDSMGIVHVVWQTPGVGELYYTRWDGINWTPPVNISNSSFASSTADIEVDKEGNLHLVWSDTTNNPEIFYKKWDGVSWSTSVNISQDPSGSATPGLAIDNTGRLFVTWWDNNGPLNIFFAHAPWYVGSYSISGNISTPAGTPIQDVMVSAGPGVNTVTDINGNYTFTGLSLNNQYTIKVTNDTHSFSPAQRAVFVTQNMAGQNFKGLDYGPAPDPFFDLPIEYDNSIETFILILKNWNEEGRINSWFDHEFPDYSLSDGILLFDGEELTQTLTTDSGVPCYENYCYDGHNGIDFSHAQPDLPGTLSSEILAVANGTVVDTKTDCVVGDKLCGGGYGNFVILHHNLDQGNDYFTRYAHMSTVSVTENITVTQGAVLGIMGTTGNSTGTHLHFGVHRDDGDNNWEEGADKAVDPFGWYGSNTDPWVADFLGAPSFPLWIHDARVIVSFLSHQLAVLKTILKDIQVTISPNTINGLVTLELLPGPVSEPSAQLRSAGHSFSLSLMEWLHDPSQQALSNRINNNFSSVSVNLPFTLTVTYSLTDTKHLDLTQLSIVHWDEATDEWLPLLTAIDPVSQTVTAFAQGLGDYDLQAPLLCPGDSFEIDDNIFSARTIQQDGTPVSRIFDIEEDQDWFLLDAESGHEYLIKTDNLGLNIDTIIEIYDIDGITLLAFDDNGGSGFASQLTFQPSMDGFYFVHVIRVPGSSFGCNASYDFSIFDQSLATPTPTPTLTDTPTPTPTYTLTPTNTPTSPPTPTETPSPTDTPTNTPTITQTPTKTPRKTNTPSLTPTPTNTTSIPTPSTTPTNTGFLGPNVNAPVINQSGDNNGYEISPSNGHFDDSVFAVDNNSGINSSTSCTNQGKDRHLYSEFNMNVPTGATINGVEVRLDTRVDSTANAPKICVQLSWDGGVTWTTAKSTPTLTTIETTYLLGGPLDTWGHFWQTGELSNANFRVRIIDVASSTSRDFFLDWAAVNVYYQP